MAASTSGYLTMKAMVQRPRAAGRVGQIRASRTQPPQAIFMKNKVAAQERAAAAPDKPVELPPSPASKNLGREGISAGDMFFPAPHMAAAAEAAAAAHKAAAEAAMREDDADPVARRDGQKGNTRGDGDGDGDGLVEESNNNPFASLELSLESRLLENTSMGGGGRDGGAPAKLVNNVVSREYKVSCGVEAGGSGSDDVVCRLEDTSEVVMECIHGSVGDNMEGLVCDVTFCAR